jgi:uncharacterized protein
MDISPTGTIWSYVVYHRAFHAGFKEDIPYAVALVDLGHGILMEGKVLGEIADVKVGLAVTGVFEDVTEEVTLIRWQLEDSPEKLPTLRKPDRT